MTNIGNESEQSWSEYFKPAWLGRHREAAIEPELPIVDPHHHIWEWLAYGLDAFLADITGGHNIRATVHLESGLARNPADPPHLVGLGETRYLVGLAEDPVLQGPGAPDVCAGIIGHVDLDLPEHLVEEALIAHIAAGKGRFKGVRLNPYYHPDVAWRSGPRARLTEDPAIRRGVAALGRHGLVCDVMAFPHQAEDVARMAATLPDVTFIMDHCGGFLGRVAKHDSYAAGLAAWREAIRTLAREGNVVMKVGGLTNDFFSGIQLHLEPEPPTSERIADVYRPFFEPCVEAFGTSRCMFESNYPADRQQVDYVVLWNGFKKLAAGTSAAEKADLFSNTARRVYTLPESR